MIKKYNIIISLHTVIVIFILIIICVSCIDDVKFEKAAETYIDSRTKKSDFINPDGSFNKALENQGFMLLWGATCDEDLKPAVTLTPLAKNEKIREGEKSALLLHFTGGFTIFLYFDENDNLVRKKSYGS